MLGEIRDIIAGIFPARKLAKEQKINAGEFEITGRWLGTPDTFRKNGTWTILFNLTGPHYGTASFYMRVETKGKEDLRIDSFTSWDGEIRCFGVNDPEAITEALRVARKAKRLIDQGRSK